MTMPQHSNRERERRDGGTAPAGVVGPSRQRPPAASTAPAASARAAHHGSFLERLSGGAAAAAAGVVSAVAGIAGGRPARRLESRWLQRVQGPRELAAPLGAQTLTREQEQARRQECAGLLSYLRAAIDKPVPTVVIAGAASGAGALRIADGLAEAARDAGLRLFSAELGGTPGRPVLQQRRVVGLTATGRGDWRLGGGSRSAAPSGTVAAGAKGQDGGVPSGAAAGAGASPGHAVAVAPAPSVPAAASPGAVESFRAGGSASGLSRWFEHPGGSVDFILVEAPPLDGAADAALLARACDGLVLVVESAVTPRDSLRRAIRIAEASGCRVLGLVVSEPRHTLPNWLRRLVSGTSPGR